MGREGRKRIERYHSLEAFVDGVKKAVHDAIGDAGSGSRPADEYGFRGGSVTR